MIFIDKNVKYYLDEQGPLAGKLTVHQPSLFPSLILEPCGWDQVDVTLRQQVKIITSIIVLKVNRYMFSFSLLFF